jgi:ribosome modulation factor
MRENMAKSKKARLTRSLQRHYQLIINGSGSNYDPWNPPFWGPTTNSQWEHRNQWSAYMFAKRWSGRSGYDIKKLQLIVIKSNDAECAYMFAKDIKGANIKKLQKVVLENGTTKTLKKFSKLPNVNKKLLENFIIIMEVLRK